MKDDLISLIIDKSKGIPRRETESFDIVNSKSIDTNEIYRIENNNCINYKYKEEDDFKILSNELRK